MRRPGAAGATLAAVLGVVVLATASLLAAHQPAPVTARGGTPGVVQGAGTADGFAPAAGPDAVPWWAVVVVLGGVVLVVGLLWVLLRDGLPFAGRDDVAAAPRSGDEEQARWSGALAQQTRAALADAAAGLDAGGDPREVVVACWVRIEEAADAAGLGRRPAETATDVARRWLAAHPDRAAVDDLAALYHLARFSTHPMTDEHRVRARTALQGALVETPA